MAEEQKEGNKRRFSSKALYEAATIGCFKENQDNVIKVSSEQDRITLSIALIASFLTVIVVIKDIIIGLEDTFIRTLGILVLFSLGLNCISLLLYILFKALNLKYEDKNRIVSWGGLSVSKNYYKRFFDFAVDKAVYAPIEVLELLLLIYLPPVFKKFFSVIVSYILTVISCVFILIIIRLIGRKLILKPKDSRKPKRKKKS